MSIAPRHVILALDRGGPTGAVVDHIRALVASEHRVCLVLIDEATVARLPADLDALRPSLEARALLAAESDVDVARLVRRSQRLDRLYVALIRPWLLGRRWRTVCQELDVAGAHRVIAADVSAITLVWRLSRRYPDLDVTTALDPPVAASRRST